MGNVAGVGQLLEAVGVPVTQAGPDSSVPGQDFATAMQQAGGPSAQDLTGTVKGQEDAEAGTKNPASGAGENAGAQSGSVKTAGAGKSDAPEQPGRRSLVGQTPAGARGVVGRGLSATLAPANLVGNKSVEAASSKPTAVAVVLNQTVAVKTQVSKDTVSQVSSFGTASPETVDGLALTPSVAAQNTSTVDILVKNAVASSITLKSGEAVTTQSTKPAGKTTSADAVNSKLTALFPQGTVDLAQGPALSVAAAASGQAAVATPVMVTNTAYGSGQPVMTAALDASATVNALAAPVQRAGLQTETGKPSHMAPRQVIAAAVPVAADASGNVSASERATAQGEVSANAAAPAAATAVGLTTPVTAASTVKPGTAGPKTMAAATTAAPAPQAAGQAVVAAAGLPEQANAGLQAALQATVSSEPNVAKTGQHGGRSSIAAAKAGDPSGIAGVGTGQVAAGKTFAVTAGPAAIVPEVVKTSAAVPMAAGHAGARTSESKVGLTAEDVPAPAVVPAAAGKATAAAEAVSSATAGLSGAAASPKDASATASPMGSLQPAALPVEPVAGLAMGAAMPVPVAHEAGAGGATVNAAGGVSGLSSGLGVVAGTHEAGGAAGLAHTTLSATPTSLEVGVSSGTHGWLKIRAELNAAGTVDASLTGTSAASAERLRTELPGLNNFLLNERVAMGSLDVRSAAHAVAATGESSATFSQAGSGQGSAGQGSGQANPGGSTVSADAGSAGGGARQQASQDAIPVVNGVGAVDEVVLGRVSDAALYGSSMELDDSAAASSVGYGTGGGWLNVRA